MLKLFDDTVGNVKVVHLNDSKGIGQEYIDRHDHMVPWDG